MHAPAMSSLRAVLCIVLVAATEGYRLVPRIIGGVSIFDRCRSPYNSMVALQFYADYYPVTFCSAVMVTDTYLVTTAKCLFKMAENQNQVATAVIGERDTAMTGEPGEQRIGIKAFKIHYDYNTTSRANDIGLIQLARPAKLGRCVKPATKMENDPNACEDVDDTCQIVGWGSFADDANANPNATNSRLPRSAAVTVYSDFISVLLSNSKQYASAPPPVGTLFAEAINPAQKACFFDWGGIVSCKRNGLNVLRGIIKIHNCNTRSGLPIQITDVPYYQTWMDRCIDSWGSCTALTGGN